MKKKMIPILILVAALAIIITPTYAQITVSSMQNIGTLGGHDSSATGINNIGQVVGYSSTTTGWQHPFIWSKHESIKDIGAPCTDCSAHAEGINDIGQVVGWSERESSGPEPAFLWTEQEGMIDIGSLGGSHTEAHGINNTGQIVGYSGSYAFIWTAQEGMTGIVPGGASYDINDIGQVVGGYYTTSGQYHAFLWSAQKGIIDLGTLGGKESIAFGINNLGQVVGRSDTASGQWHAFLWTPQGGMIDLRTLGGDYSDAYDINDLGQIVGRASIATDEDSTTHVKKYHAFLWTTDEGMTDLGTFSRDCIIGECNYSIAFGINNHGQIVGWSDTTSGDRNAFILEITTDNISPIITLNGENPMTVYVGSIYIDPGATAIDNIDGQVPVTMTGSVDTNTVGKYIITYTATDRAGNPVSLTRTINVIYNFAGFFQPIDNLPTWNPVKAGSAIPAKFSLNGDRGLDIFAVGYPVSQKVDCISGHSIGPIEDTATAGVSSLSYNATIDQYSYIWKTDKAWKNTCRQLTILLKDSTYHNASFNLK